MKRIVVSVVFIVLLSLVFAGCTKEEEKDETALQPPAGGEMTGEEITGEKEEKELLPPELPGAVIVMIDNFSKARPQIGLDKADIVYEMMAEGGITRYMAIFYSKGADKIGPVRSARYYFVELAKGYDAPLAHAGGSQEALSLVYQLKLKDLDEIYNAGSYFWRDKSRKMPHNLYTSTDELIRGAKAKGYELIPLEALPLSEDFRGEKLEQGDEITLDYSTNQYKNVVSWQYNGQEYERYVNGKKYETADNITITADNLLIITAKTKTKVVDGVPLSEIDIIGAGEVRYYNGEVLSTGTWEKTSASSNIVFYNEQGEKACFKPGQTWIQVVSDWGKVDTGESK